MPLIAMPREMGSLGRDVAARIAERTNRKVVYHEIIGQLADKKRLRKSHVIRFLEGTAGLWERLTSDQTSVSIFTADETFRLLRDGSTAVIRGWGAVHLLRAVPHVMRVRICAPLELRIARMMERLGTDRRDSVRDEILASEEAHSAITKRHFGVNWREAENYDLVLSTERMSVDECVEEIESMMRLPRFQETPESIRLVSDLAVEWSTRAALRRDPRTSALNISIEPEAGKVRLAGIVDTPEQVEAAAEIAARVEGVERVENTLKAAKKAGSRYLREA